MFTKTTAVIFIITFMVAWLGFFGILTGIGLWVLFLMAFDTAPRADQKLDQILGEKMWLKEAAKKDEAA